jgi:2-keto-4-pentenoate hydratase
MRGSGRLKGSAGVFGGLAMIAMIALLAGCSDEQSAEAPQSTEAPMPVAMLDCGYDFATPFFEAYQASRLFMESEEAAANITDISAGECQQHNLLTLLESARGAPVGYKVGLASKAAQEQMGVPSPIVGVLFDGMLKPDGSEISVSSGGLLIYELDLLARVSDSAIMTATTLDDVASAIDQIIPFIEVADLMVPRDGRFTAPLIVAMNVAPRYGITGAPIPFEATPEWIEALAQMQARLSTDDGTLIVEGAGADLDGHPFSMALFLVAEAVRRGWQIQAGDMISFGSFGPLQFAVPGSGATAVYEGLPGGPATVGVSFAD